MTFLEWIKPAFEGKDGRASSRALTNFWLVLNVTGVVASAIILAFRIALSDSITDKATNALWAIIWLVVILLVAILLIYQIVTAQNIKESIMAFKGTASQIDTITTTKTTQETMKIEDPSTPN